ncbi:toxin-antitoxin system HepN family antidote component [Cyanobacterium sp. HL-69]|uniref:HEPN domain protein n=1 Tax=Cyanobacterium aponinum (strain PCC 10605) TaxID=755178 RepID=K9Z4K4_CYAAP|nr:HEPN domain-containing protein [Cyanobacterium aponinum]AFZ53318.1 HEPN domain protein [Cyanobacterium aponinum PCC 10605]AUC62346.1 toxin-antitoxin system HepN family antidote component [Cyanobacterium sp. HL-69]
MKNEQKLLLEKAQESLRASKILLENQLPDFAVARAYYTMFYIAEAFLLKQDLTYSSHSAVIAGFGREFAKTKRIPVEYHRYLIEAQQKRTEADYNLKPNITLQEAENIINKAQNMLDFTNNNIDII